jgi:brefeldin A-inhibited guanine nucleotide-exchange protein
VASPGPTTKSSTVAGAAVEPMCRGYELGDEAVELQLLKGLLTSISCASFQVHGEALLRCVRTCYNIFLGSKSEVNQTTAKATLTQALTIVFHRMEADSALVPAAGDHRDGPAVSWRHRRERLSRGAVRAGLRQPCGH